MVKTIVEPSGTSASVSMALSVSTAPLMDEMKYGMEKVTFLRLSAELVVEPHSMSAM